MSSFIWSFIWFGKGCFNLASIQAHVPTNAGMPVSLYSSLFQKLVDTCIMLLFIFIIKQWLINLKSAQRSECYVSFRQSNFTNLNIFKIECVYFEPTFGFSQLQKINSMSSQTWLYSTDYTVLSALHLYWESLFSAEFLVGIREGCRICLKYILNCLKKLSSL